MSLERSRRGLQKRDESVLLCERVASVEGHLHEHAFRFHQVELKPRGQTFDASTTVMLRVVSPHSRPRCRSWRSVRPLECRRASGARRDLFSSRFFVDLLPAFSLRNLSCAVTSRSRSLSAIGVFSTLEWPTPRTMGRVNSKGPYAVADDAVRR